MGRYAFKMFKKFSIYYVPHLDLRDCDLERCLLLLLCLGLRDLDLLLGGDWDIDFLLGDLDFDLCVQEEWDLDFDLLLFGLWEWDIMQDLEWDGWWGLWEWGCLLHKNNEKCMESKHTGVHKVIYLYTNPLYSHLSLARWLQYHIDNTFFAQSIRLQHNARGLVKYWWCMGSKGVLQLLIPTTEATKG